MVYKKDFDIRCRKSGNRLAGHENEVSYYIVCKKSNKEIQHPEFHRKSDADAWLSKNVRIAKEIIKAKNEGRI